LVLTGATCLGADPALFFPEPGDTETEAQAVAICVSCPARAACLARALANGECYGIFGGVNLETARRPQVAVTDERRAGKEITETMSNPTPEQIAARSQPYLPDGSPNPYLMYDPTAAEKYLATLEAEASIDADAEAGWADEWDSADSNAYQDRVEAGLEAEGEP
jgi:Transcription factor WhiB